MLVIKCTLEWSPEFSILIGTIFWGYLQKARNLATSFALAEVVNKMDGCPNKFSSHFLLPKITASNNLYHKFLLLDLKNWMFENFRGCLVNGFKQPFLVFKQHFTHFNALFHPHVFPQMFLNNNFQFLNICTKRTLSY